MQISNRRVALGPPLLQRLVEAGIEYDDVVAALERERSERFCDNFRQLLDAVASRRDRPGAASGYQPRRNDNSPPRRRRPRTAAGEAAGCSIAAPAAAGAQERSRSPL